MRTTPPTLSIQKRSKTGKRVTWNPVLTTDAVLRRPEHTAWDLFCYEVLASKEDPEEDAKEENHHDARVPPLCFCHICKYEVLCVPSDLPADKEGPIRFVPWEDEE